MRPEGFPVLRRTLSDEICGIRQVFFFHSRTPKDIRSSLLDLCQPVDEFGNPSVYSYPGLCFVRVTREDTIHWDVLSLKELSLFESLYLSQRRWCCQRLFPPLNLHKFLRFHRHYLNYSSPKCF